LRILKHCVSGTRGVLAAAYVLSLAPIGPSKAQAQGGGALGKASARARGRPAVATAVAG